MGTIVTLPEFQEYQLALSATRRDVVSHRLAAIPRVQLNTLHLNY